MLTRLLPFVNCGFESVLTVVLDQVKRVIGIEQSAAAVEDAKRNAIKNNITNCSFICGKADEEIPKLSDALFGSVKTDLVVIANPARSGLRPSVIEQLRELRNVEKVIYVSCKPGGEALKNFVHLASASSSKSTGFTPIIAQPVDLFPQTNHCELIMTFERFM